MDNNELSQEEQKLTFQNQLLYSLNDMDMTASVIQNFTTSFEVFLPRSINNEGHEYVITRLSENSFKNSTNLVIQFAPDSELRTIEKNAFAGSTIEKILVPSSLSELQEGWCAYALNLVNVSIMPGNQYYQNYNEIFIIEKSDKNDVLIFARRDIKTASIPPNITRIASWSFAYSSINNIIIPTQVTQIGENAFAFCKNLQKVEFSPDSQLRTIEKFAFHRSKIERIFIPPHITTICEGVFSYCKQLNQVDFSPDSELKIIEKNAFKYSSIKSITIPSKVSELRDGWCKRTEYLTDVTVMSNNQYFKNYDDKLIVGKSDIKNDKFDVLVFANRKINTVKIPPDITKIQPYAFADSIIECISIPPHVTHISEGAFDWCYLLQKVEFHPESELKVIESKAFHYSIIESFYIPRHVSYIGDNAFYNCLDLNIVEIDEDAETEKIRKAVFSDCANALIMIPIKMKNAFQ